MDSLYENYPNFYPNIDCKIASNIASNYRQYNNQWLPNYGWTQSAQTSYYEPNFMYNHLEPLNSYQTHAVQEVDPYPYHTHTHSYPLTDIQSHNYLEPTEGVLRQNCDNLIPLSVQEMEKQIKTERNIEEIICDESRDLQMNCFQIRHEVIQMRNDNSCETPVEYNNENLKNSTVLNMEMISKEPRIRRKNRRLMSYDELKRDKRESNRLAATKCRQKKLHQLDLLDRHSKRLFDENTKLERTLNDIKVKVFEAKLALIYHRNQGCLLNAFRN